MMKVTSLYLNSCLEGECNSKYSHIRVVVDDVSVYLKRCGLRILAGWWQFLKSLINTNKD